MMHLILAVIIFLACTICESQRLDKNSSLARGRKGHPLLTSPADRRLLWPNETIAPVVIDSIYYFKGVRKEYDPKVDTIGWCRRIPHLVNLDVIPKFDDFVDCPRKVDIGMCVGSCNHNHYYDNRHAEILFQMYQNGHTTAKPCCAATEFELFTFCREDGVSGTHREFVVKRCQCRG